MYDTSRLQHAQHEKKPGTPGTGNSPHMYDTYFRIYAAWKKPDTGYAPHIYVPTRIRYYAACCVLLFARKNE